jgi:hypothetical protein
LLCNQDSNVKQLVLVQVVTTALLVAGSPSEQYNNSHYFGQECLSHENIQQFKSMLRSKHGLQSVDLTLNALGSAGLAEIAPAHRNTFLKTLIFASNGIGSYTAPKYVQTCELLRRNNKTITSLCIADNVFGRNAAARRIFEGCAAIQHRLILTIVNWVTMVFYF